MRKPASYTAKEEGKEPFTGTDAQLRRVVTEKLLDNSPIIKTTLGDAGNETQESAKGILIPAAHLYLLNTYGSVEEVAHRQKVGDVDNAAKLARSDAIQFLANTGVHDQTAEMLVRVFLEGVDRNAREQFSVTPRSPSIS